MVFLVDKIMPNSSAPKPLIDASRPSAMSTWSKVIFTADPLCSVRSDFSSFSK
jgi:hypothetical protein